MDPDAVLCVRLLEEKKPFASVTIMSRDGSSPRGPGARMILWDGVTDGIIGAVTPAEIAVSVIAEILQQVRKNVN